jgi:hypothetical protein
MVVGIIEKTEVDTVLLLLTALGLLVMLISAQGYTGGIGFRGIAFLKYGKRIWQFSNRLFGGILTGSSLILKKAQDRLTKNKKQFKIVSMITI